ncbi:hypothetical protein DL96DRAFT_1595886 [Flagelloscypha sp. PMI_526]|nr:hypothetical protein DL96DRAFT_1595886 [Flagelloscypha sp. PMI_526]
MEVSRSLPLDILRLLFEFSASTSFNSALALSLVSKEVQRWTDPYLFETVQKTGENYSGIPETSLLGQLFMSNASPRIVVARSYVRTLAWDKFVPQDSYVKKALDIFPNLVQLCLWGNIFPYQPQDSFSRHFEITQTHTSLRRIATCLHNRSKAPPNGFGSPFWMNITHLQIRYLDAVSSSESAFQVPLFTSMSSLTHLALSPFASENDPDADLAFSRAKASFPPSLILCLLALKSSRVVAPMSIRSWLSEMTDACLKIDERIVMWWTIPKDDVDESAVVKSRDSFQEWCRVQDGAQTYWDMGEAILKRRREQLRNI